AARTGGHGWRRACVVPPARAGRDDPRSPGVAGLRGIARAGGGARGAGRRALSGRPARGDVEPPGGRGLRVVAPGGVALRGGGAGPLAQPGAAARGGRGIPVANEALRAALVRILGGEPVVDAENGHVLVPATRVVDVEEGLRALGADVTYRRLAPANARHLSWAPQLPEDLSGARPRLREPFHGALDRAVPGLNPDAALAGYQSEAVAFILHHAHTCLLADDMGLGKTL